MKDWKNAQQCERLQISSGVSPSILHKIVINGAGSLANLLLHFQEVTNTLEFDGILTDDQLDIRNLRPLPTVLMRNLGRL